MAFNPPIPFRRSVQRGIGLIETMVGILIGMVVVLVVYNTLILAEEHKRANIGIADAQVTGQLTQFILGRELSNGGAALMMGAESLAGCTDWRLKPLPVAIRSGATNNDPDELTVFYSTSPRIAHPVRLAAGVNTPDPIPVESPNGFKVNDWFVVTNGSSDCSLGKVSGITQLNGDAYPPASKGGRIKLEYAPSSLFNFTSTANSRVINLGPTLWRVHYTVDSAKAQLNSQNVNWIEPGAPSYPPVVPLAQNIVLIKAQYGIGAGVNNLVDCWTGANNDDTCGNGVNYTGPTDPKTTAGGAGSFPATATLQQLRSVKAIRLAIVVRSEDQARDDVASAHLTGQTAWLFNCSANDATCQGRIDIDNTILRDGFRYRIYETTIPLRNSLWNQTS